MSWTHLILSFTATLSYGVLFNVPKKALIGGGLIGMSGWLLVSMFIYYFQFSYMAAALIASFVVATISQIASKMMKMPSTNFSIAGIIPLVPGAMAYRTMRSFVDGDYVNGLALATETLLSAGAIAAGLMFSLAIFFSGKGMGWRHGTKRA
ncbi:threonine/serine exporter family protein [Caldalkalibacillus mannanilyticus]|uniref:threonine/serine exporter family protein n=1 Tax=Caldalkalibacillus mannanilyticus TaxID=1418 RepID=UPI00046AF929|nr:threonine/serine exporter family protein [Caldalkalibacillus mannanilyticus]